MTSSTRKLGMVAATAAVLSVAVLVQPIPIALSQQQHDQHMMQMHGQGTTPVPTMPGQDAFGAIQEIVRILEADPKTDWSKVNLEALRQHLIDMNEVTLKADASVKQIDGGLEIAVTGDGRTLAAIQRMIPAHAQAINGLKGWSAKAEANSEWRTAHGHFERPSRGKAYSWPQLHRPAREWCASSAPPSRYGQGRVRALPVT